MLISLISNLIISYSAFNSLPSHGHLKSAFLKSFAFDSPHYTTKPAYSNFSTLETAAALISKSSVSGDRRHRFNLTV